MELQLNVNEDDIKYLRELIDKNAPLNNKDITDEQAEELISEYGNPNLAFGAYIENLSKDEVIPKVTLSEEDIGPTSILEGDTKLPIDDSTTYDVDDQENDVDEDYVTDQTKEGLFNFHEEGVSDSIVINEGLYKERIQENETYLVVYKEDGELIDKIITINTIRGNKVDILDEENNRSTLLLDMESNLILNSDDYDFDIIEFERLIELENINDVANEDLFIKKEFKTEIEIEVEETENKLYTFQEKKESLITELIYQLNAYNDDNLIKQICDITNNYINMIQEKKDKDIDDSDVLPFLNEGEAVKLPKWIIPIVKNVKKIYIEDDDMVDDHDDIKTLQLLEEFEKKDNITKDDKNTYQTLSRSLNNFEPYENILTNVMLQHSGNYFRDCSDSTPCHGINNSYTIELNKTRDELIIPLIKDGITVFETIRTLQTLPFVGLYLLSHKYIASTLENKGILSINELSIINELKNNMVHLREFINNDNIVHKSIGIDTLRNDIWSNNIHRFHLNETCTTENINNILIDNLPTCSDILESFPSDTLKYILNYKSLQKLLISYNINYNSFNITKREDINRLIKRNISEYIINYNKRIKKSPIKTKSKKMKILTTKDKIELSREFIFSIFVIPIRNNYLEKFINKFSREPLEYEKQQFLYEKGSDKILLCKHHLYNLKINDDIDAFNSFKQIFGIENKGIIICKHCGDYLCHDDFSLLEGFDDSNAPKQTREVLDTEDSVKVLSDEQLSIKKMIQKISSLLNIELNEYDKQKIINFFDLVNHNELENQRYSQTNIAKKHPTYKELKDKYKKLFVYPESSQKIKRQNKKFKKEYDKEVSNFQKYLEDCNTVLIISFLILFHLQTSSPPYQIKTKELVYLWDNQTLINNTDGLIQNIHNKIRMETIDSLILPLNKASTRYNKDKQFKNINTLINESNTYTKLPNFKIQFINTAKYILRNSSINTQLIDYINIKNNLTNSIYLREYWSSYKPLPDTDLIQNINKIINSQLTNSDIQKYLYRKGIDTYYENISSMVPMDDVYNTPRYLTLNIPFTSILRNESYKRLFEYSTHLYGRSKENNQINILIKSFINSINDKNIENLLIKNGWDNINDRLTLIDYSQLKNIFFEEIIKYFKNKNKNDADTIDIFKYININNWNGMLLNGHSKRNYHNINPKVIPTKDFNELLETYVIPENEDDEKETKVTIIERLFKKYCTDEDGNISNVLNNDKFISNLIDDPVFIKRIKTCDNNLNINEDNFNRILDYRKGKTLLSDFKEILIESHFIEKRLHKFIIHNNYLEYGGDEAYNIFREIDNITKKLDETEETIIKGEYRNVFNSIEDYKTNCIQRIKEFYKNAYEEKILNTDQILQYKKMWKTIDKLDIYIDNYLEDSNHIHNNISNIIYIIGRLTNSGSEDVGTVFNDQIPKQWKLSDVNNEEFKKFINEKEFLIHNDIFIGNNKYEGFYRYEKYNQNKLCFEGLLSYINKVYKGGINMLNGYDKSYYTRTYNKSFIQFIFIFLFINMIEYIEGLYDEQSIISKQANEIFKLLQQEDEIKLSYSIEICTQLTFDILIHFISEYIDDGWINQTQLLSDKLSKQKEREKQNLINDLESKTADARAVTVEKQKYGIINWFAMGAVGHLDLIKSEKYASQLDEERINRIKEMYMQNETSIEAIEAVGINSDQLQQDIHITDNIKDEGYSQVDNDREDEGDDDGDNDGDYREN